MLRLAQNLEKLRMPLLCGVLFAASLSGCMGIRTEGEKEARNDLGALSGKYRPEDREVTLPVLDDKATLSTFLTYAMLNQPRVAAAYYEYVAAVERITVDRSLADPRFTFQMDITNVINSIMPGLMIDVPWPTKLIDRANIATAESKAKYYAFERAVIQTAFEVKVPYYQLNFLQERIRINREILLRVTKIEELAKVQFEAGISSLQDVLRAQMEQERLKTEISNLEDSRNPLMSKLKTALGMTYAQENPPLPAKFEPGILNVNSDQLFTIAMERNPQLKSMEAEIRAAEEGISLARKSRLPDFTFGVEGDVNTAPVMVRPKIEVTLPVWLDKIAAEIAAAQARKSAADARFSSEQIQLAVEFANKTFMYREANRNLKLLSGRLIAKARLSLDVANESYSAGKTDFINLMDAERTLLEFQLAEVGARLQCELALAELSMIIGEKPQNAPTLDKPQNKEQK